MRQFRLVLFCTLFVWGLCDPAFAQTGRAEANEILRKVAETYRNRSNYRFAYRTISSMKMKDNGGRYETLQEASLLLAVRSPQIWRAERRDAYDAWQAGSDGKLTWAYKPALQQYVRKAAVSLDELKPPWRGEAASLIGSALWQRLGLRLDRYDGLGDPNAATTRLLADEALLVAGQKHLCFVVESRSIEPLQEGEEYQTTYWIEQQSFVVLRETFYTKRYMPNQIGMTESSLTFECTDYRVNEPLPDSEFAFLPPARAREVHWFVQPGEGQPRRSPGERPALDLARWRSKEAPLVPLKDLDGETVSLQDLRGKVVVLNFWATWCGPCLAEMPYLEKLQQEYKDKAVVVVGVSAEEPAVVRQFLKTKGYSYRFWLDPLQRADVLFELNNSIPHTFFLTRDGKIAESYRSSRRETELRAGIEQALQGLEATNSAAASQACVPKLLTPAPNASLMNGRSDKNSFHFWEFDWSDCPGVSDYQLYVRGPGATFALIDNDALRSSNFTTSFSSGYVPEALRRGWLWRVRAKLNGQWGEWSELRSFDVEPPAEERASLPAPKLLAPAPKTVFNHYPRKTVLSWEPVPGAVAYGVEVDWFMQRWNTDHQGRSESLYSGIQETQLTFSFMGAQPGRWRVWAVDAQGRAGAKSEWWEFSYTK